jgi:hypothetical protein
MIKQGSRWGSVDGKNFIVLAEVYLDDGVWVHYREEANKEGTPKEYSCYRESFESRFSPLPDEH